jgi:hypothetical protein
MFAAMAAFAACADPQQRATRRGAATVAAASPDPEVVASPARASAPVRAGPSVAARAVPGGRPAARAGTPPSAGVRYRFDDGFADDRGALPLRVVSAGGEIAMVERADGRAVRFPPPCAHYGSARCARVILESGPAPFLNPGMRAIRFGAIIRMAPEEASKGANVIQKG